MLRRLGTIAIVPALFLLAAGCESRASRPAAARPAPAKFADEVSAPRDEDYAKARASYQSKVTWTGHAPVAAKVAQVPKGAEELKYASGGLALRSFVTPDPGDGAKHPAVVFLGDGFNFDARDWSLADKYRAGGFVVLAPLPRGENQQKGIYTMFYGEVDDVLAATEALAKLPYVDGARIDLAGVREGGTQALLCAMASGRFRSVAAIDPVLDIAAFTKQNRHLVAFDRKVVREFQLRSPLAYATSLKCPARLYVRAGDADAAAAAREFERRARGKSLDAEAVPVPGDKPAAAVAAAVGRSIEFFKSR
ncbi:MAG TPA: prolyl oligopeptidase family serine peptidase [Isosphaeraceae bacterium]|jgi:dipeptidyl aminopeptidase/acylaminoacyl peptidase|nr:prolyl oligopeptidase family serine peptidase [Isosphaeraceae bacterium]